jgi:hypothetical protein
MGNTPLDMPFVQTEIVHGGAQSMPYDYDNDGTNVFGSSGLAYYSEIEADTADLAIGSDWTKEGVKALALYFYGDPNNDANATEHMYVALEDAYTHVGIMPYDGHMNDVMQASWHEWNIDLQDFTRKGVDLTNVKKVYIGFGDRNNHPAPGGSGKVYFDDIRLYPPRCRVEYGPVSDFTGEFGEPDCIVDNWELRMMGRDWLQSDYTIAAQEPNAPLVWYTFDETAGTVAADAMGNYHATLPSAGNWEPTGGYDANGCLDFDGTFVATVPAGVFDRPFEKGITISVWVNGAASQPLNSSIFYGENAGATSLFARCPWGDGEILFKAGDGNINDGVSWVGAQTSDYSGTWNHYAFVKNRIEGQQRMRIVLNGQVVAEIASAASPILVTDFAIGAEGLTAPGHTYEGKLDDFRIYNYALSQPEIANVMGQTGIYLPVASSANLYDQEPEDSRKVNFKDFALLADGWLQQQLWPPSP